VTFSTGHLLKRDQILETHEPIFLGNHVPTVLQLRQAYFGKPLQTSIAEAAMLSDCPRPHQPTTPSSTQAGEAGSSCERMEENGFITSAGLSAKTEELKVESSRRRTRSLNMLQKLSGSWF
jgi:membrane carboxypeptidase/penicillin-binding protein